MSQPSKCSYDPREMAGKPIGMFHCPECGEMVLAGVSHPDYSLLEDDDAWLEQPKRYGTDEDGALIDKENR